MIGLDGERRACRATTSTSHAGARLALDQSWEFASPNYLDDCEALTYLGRLEASQSAFKASPSQVKALQEDSLAYLSQLHPTTLDTMVQLELRLATTTEDSIKSIKDRLQQFSSDPITLSSHNTETDEIVFDFGVANDEMYQALGEQCRAWTDEPNPKVIVYALTRAQ